MEKRDLPSADIVPFKELKAILFHRAKSKIVVISDPDIVFNFQLFSMLASEDTSFSKTFYQMIREAVDDAIIFTDKGPVKVKNVKYAFVNYENVCIIVLENGDERCVLNGNPKGELVKYSIVDSVDKLKLTTGELKNYILDNADNFPHMRSLTRRIERFQIPRSEFSRQKSRLAELCRQDDFIMEEMHNYLHEIIVLFNNSCFVLK